MARFKKYLWCAFWVVLVVLAAVFLWKNISAHPRYGEVLLAYDMTPAGDRVEIQLEEGDEYDVIHFIELSPTWESGPFLGAVSEHSYRLRTAGEDRYSLKHQEEGGLEKGFFGGSPDESIELPALGDGFHVAYAFNAQSGKGWLYAGVTADPALLTDGRTVHILRLDPNFYVYFWVDYENK